MKKHQFKWVINACALSACVFVVAALNGCTGAAGGEHYGPNVIGEQSQSAVSNDDWAKKEAEQAKNLEVSKPPSNQPANHAGRWEAGYYSSLLCMRCHSRDTEEELLRIPESHLVKDEKGKFVVDPSRELCINCHPLAEPAESNSSSSDK